MFFFFLIYKNFILQAKDEMMSSVKTLGQLGYKLYGSNGTADFYTRNGVKVIYLFIYLIL